MKELYEFFNYLGSIKCNEETLIRNLNNEAKDFLTEYYFKFISGGKGLFEFNMSKEDLGISFSGDILEIIMCTTIYSDPDDRAEMYAAYDRTSESYVLLFKNEYGDEDYRCFYSIDKKVWFEGKLPEDREIDFNSINYNRIDELTTLNYNDEFVKEEVKKLIRGTFEELELKAIHFCDSNCDETIMQTIRDEYDSVGLWIDFKNDPNPLRNRSYCLTNFRGRFFLYNMTVIGRDIYDV